MEVTRTSMEMEWLLKTGEVDRALRGEEQEEVVVGSPEVGRPVGV